MIKILSRMCANQRRNAVKNAGASQSGNVFFAMFGAVVMVGAIGFTASGILRGPMKTMADVSQKAEAEAEIISNMQLVALSVSDMADQDCDKDGVVEPAEWTAGTGPTGGGLLPNTVRSSNTTDPWGTQYGYCVWDHGTAIDAAGCGGGTQSRLQGADPSGGGSPQVRKQTVFAVISAGPDRTFNTTCNDFADTNTDGDPDTELVQRGNDDIAMTFNYGEASVATSSKWKLKDAESGAQGSATVALEQSVELSGNKVQIGASGQPTGLLDLSAGGLMLPRESNPGTNADTGACVAGGLNDKQLRVNTATDPDTLEICTNGVWTQIGGDVGSGGGGGGSSCTGYSPNAVALGAGDYVTIGSLTGVSDGKTWTGSLWFKTSNSAYQEIFKTTDFTGNLSISVTGSGTSNVFRIFAEDSGATTRLDLRSVVTGLDDGAWHHMMFSVDMADSNKRHLYIDGVDTLNALTYTNATLDFTSDSYSVGCCGQFTGDLADVWVDFNTYVDFSDPANRQAFYKSGSAVYLGDDGSLPTGTAPDVFLSGDTATWHTNKGTGGGFTENGTIADAATSITGVCPVDGSGGGGSGSDVTDGLVAHWKMDDVGTTTIVDSVGTYDSTFFGNATVNSVEGIDGTALDFDGSNDCILLPNPNDLVQNVGAVTLSFWIKPEVLPSTAGTRYVLFALAENGATENSRLTVEYTLANIVGIGGRAPDGGAWQAIETIQTLAVDTWYHIVTVSDYANDSAAIYINGQPVGTTGSFSHTGTATTNSTSSSGAIGNEDTCQSSPFSRYYNGVMDDVRVYHRALSATEINSLYNYYTGGTVTVQPAQAMAWGEGDYEKIGDGAGTTDQASPVYVSNISDFVYVSSGKYHACGIDSAGDAWCWGNRSSGKLGDGGATSGNQATPVLVTGGYTWAQISAGEDFVCGVTTSGAGYCWGFNSNGKVGNGTNGTDETTGPALVTGGHLWRHIEAGYENSCGIASDGVGYCWGMPGEGRNGNNDTTTVLNTPGLISGGGTWVKMALGNYSQCGIKADNEIYCWGNGANGKLGDGALSANLVPNVISESGPWVDVSVGQDHACGVKADGTAWCWGDDTDGQLGNGAGITGDQTTPTQVANITNFIAITVGNFYSCGLTTDGTAYCWGEDNVSETLGDGAGSSNQASPTLVDTTKKFAQIDALDTHTTALVGTPGSSGGSDTGSYCEAATPNGIDFDGSVYLTTNSIDPGSDGKTLTVAGWVKRTTSGVDETLFASSGSAIRIRFDSSNRFQVMAENSGGTIIASLRTTDTFTDTNWHHFMVSFDLTDANKRHMYIDGQAANWTPVTYTNDTIDFTVASHAVGALVGGSGKLTGSLADLWIDTNTYIDFSNAENRQKFYNAGGVDLGADGSTPTGTAPLIFLSGAAADWHTNKGTGGGFTETGGALADSASDATTGENCPEGVCPAYSPNGVNFDGTNDYLINNSTSGSTSETKWSGSFWIKRAVTGVLDVIYDRRDPGDLKRVDIDFLAANDRISFLAQNSSNVTVLNLESDPITDTDWHHVMFSFDLSDSSKRHIYIDGVPAINNVATYNTAETMDFSGDAEAIGDAVSLCCKFSGDMADFWLDFGTYIDLSIAENRKKFINTSGNPSYLGENGSYPTGSVPDLYFSGVTADWHLNLGTAGTFTETGALTDAAAAPETGTNCYVASAPGVAIIEDFTANQTVTQSVVAGNALETYGTIISRESDAYGTEAGIGFLVKGTPADDDEAGAGISAIKSGLTGQTGLAFKTQNADGDYQPRAFLDHDGDFGLDVAVPSDVKAKLQIRDIVGATWPATYNRGLLVNGGPDTDLGGFGRARQEFLFLSVGYDHACGIKGDGTAWCWGSDSTGQLGNTGGNQTSPDQVDDADSWISISSEANHSCGIKTDGTAWCWGDDTYGQLGNGGGSHQYSPGQVSDAGPWASISTGALLTCGIKTDGTAWCWGDDSDGQLGNGATSGTQQTPVQVNDAGPWASISAGAYHACGIKTDGTAWCWGSDTQYVLGNGATTGTQQTPVQVNDAGPWASISSGYSHTCGVKTDGTAWCWGDDADGQLGNNTDGGQESPDQINDAGPWASISAVYYMTCGVKTDGTAWCWGDESSGELGNGATTGDQINPVQINDAGPWKGIKAGHGFACGTKTDGTVWCWGDDAQGAIGNGGTTGTQESPDQVNDSGPWKTEEIATSGTYAPNAVHFDGTNDYMGVDETYFNGPITSKMGTVSFWFKLDAATDTRFINTTSADFDIRYRSGTQEIQIRGNNSGGTEILNGTTSNLNGDTTGWHHFMASWDMSDNNKRHIYLDGVVDESFSTYTDAAVNYIDAAQNLGVGASSTGLEKLNGGLADYWVDFGTYIDLSDPANRQKFYYDGGPVYLGSDGSLPTGFTPDIYFTGDTADWHTNKGEGTGFVEVGELTDFAIAPPMGIRPAGAAAAVSYLGLEGANDAASTVLYGNNLVIADTDVDGSTISEMMRLDANGYTIFSTGFVDIINRNMGTESRSSGAQLSGQIVLERGRGTESSPSDVADGDIIGAITFSGRNSSGITTDANAAIYAKVNGAASGANIPADIHFSTDTAGAALSSSDMVLRSDGDLGIGTATVEGRVQVAGRTTFDNGLRIGDDSDCTDAADDGVLRVNSGNLEYCEGTAWNSLMGSGGGGGGGDSDGYVSLDAEGTGMLFAWGKNNNRNLGSYDGQFSDSAVPVMVANAYGAVKIKMSYYTTCYLTETGRLWCWGTRTDYALGDNATTPSTAMPQTVDHPTPLRWIDFSIGQNHGCAIDSARDMYCWGKGDVGQIGDGDGASDSTPDLVLGGHEWEKVDVWNFTSCGITTAGDAYCWGNNTFGNLGSGSGSGSLNTPQLVLGGHSWDQITVGERHTCGLTTDGDAYCWGENACGSLGNGATSGNYNSPQAVNVGIKWAYLDAGRDTCGVTVQGTLLCWGRISTAQCGGGTEIRAPEPWPISMGEGIKWSKVAVGNGTACGLSTTGKGYCWGQGGSGERGDGDLDDVFTGVEEIDSDLRFMQIDAGNGEAIALTHPVYSKVSLAAAWGKDTNNMLGNDSNVSDHSVPRLVYHHYDWVELDGADDHTCGIVENGDMYCWGNNSHGELGNNNSGTDSDTPVLVNGSIKWKHVTTSQDLSCGISVNGDAYCWGDDTGDAGRVGDGGAGSNKAVPTLVIGGHKWTQISAGLYVVCGVTTTGDGYCWGEETQGDLGNAGAIGETVYEPDIVVGSHKWKKIVPSVGPEHVTCGLRTDGAAYCWGEDTDGSLGNGAGDSGAQASPVAVGGGFTFVDIGGGGSHCGIDETGDAYCWGRGNNGEMGTDAGGADYFVPATAVNGGHKWKKIVGGYKHLCGLTIDNIVYCWGNNDAGQLGAGFTNTGSTSDTPQLTLTEARPADLWGADEGGIVTFRDDESVVTTQCSPGELKFNDLYTSTTGSDLTTDEIEITGTEGVCRLSVASESPTVTIYLNTVAQSGSFVDVENGDKIYLEIESPGSVGSSYTTYVSLGDKQTTQTTTTDRKIVFITADNTMTANLGGIAGADAICQAAADAESLGGTYKAWISDAVDGYPAARFSHWNYQYVLVNGSTKVSDNWADLTDNSIDNKIDKTEDNATLAWTTWTNTDGDGTPVGSNNCGNWLDDNWALNGLYGDNPLTNNTWTNFGTNQCNFQKSLYCFEQ